jgi:hypothetical protein
LQQTIEPRAGIEHALAQSAASTHPVRGRGRAVWNVFAPFNSMIVLGIVLSLILRLLRR